LQKAEEDITIYVHDVSNPNVEAGLRDILDEGIADSAVSIFIQEALNAL